MRSAYCTLRFIALGNVIRGFGNGFERFQPAQDAVSLRTFLSLCVRQQILLFRARTWFVTCCTIILYNKKEIAMTIETTYSQAREQFKTLMDRAVDDREVVLVRRRSGGDVAMIAADELQSLMETAHLLRSPKNAERLLVALARARAGDVAPTSVDTLEKHFGLEA